MMDFFSLALLSCVKIPREPTSKASNLGVRAVICVRKWAYLLVLSVCLFVIFVSNGTDNSKMFTVFTHGPGVAAVPWVNRWQFRRRRSGGGGGQGRVKN